MVSVPEPKGFDLHTHSFLSDGTTSPRQIAMEAQAFGLAGFALTDHDTIDGWSQARAASQEFGIDFLPGVEITTRSEGSSRHLLAYCVRDDAGELFEQLERVRTQRAHRAQEIVRRLSVDFSITWEEVSESGDALSIGRPHIADALVAAGYFQDRSAAFAGVLHPGSSYYIGTYAIDTKEAIRMVRDAGGVTVLAHPAAMRQRRPVSAQQLASFAEAGLWGVELDHPENLEQWIPPLRTQATQLGLEMTGASDYHGAGKPNRLGERVSSVELVTRLRAQATGPVH